MTGGRVGEVAGGAVVEDLVLELELRLPQPRDLVVELGQLGVQRPLLRRELDLNSKNISDLGTKNI